MKHFDPLYICLLIAIGTSANSQTLKNIHRHDLPVLQISIDLIDKVETVEVDGQKYLHVIQFNGFVNEVLVSQIDSITHSEGEALDPAQLGNLRTASVMGVVSGPTGAPEMNALVRSPYGGEETRTDANGVFFLNNIIVYDKLGYITIEKTGFHKGSRSFLPIAQGSNRVNVQLLPMIQTGNFMAGNGGTVSYGLLQINFPANGIEQDGQPFTGSVKVYSRALDPTSTGMFDQMPGELLGAMSDSLRLLRSFGMAVIELRDSNMNELQLAEGASATLIFNIPEALQADAPETIDWWSFDEARGFWQHEGEAQKLGNQYIGSASHFSWWNYDVPENFNDFHGSVNTADGTPISDALVNVVSPTMGIGATYTNAEGEFSGRVPKNQLLTLNIYLTCETTNDWNLVYTEDFVSVAEPIIGLYQPESLYDRYPVKGIVLDCNEQTIQSGYAMMGLKIFLTTNGTFQIQTCLTGEYALRAFNTTSPDSIMVSEILHIQVESGGIDVGSMLTCSDRFGTVTDIDGNHYNTLLFGNNVWMLENLKSSRFSNGLIIPNITNNYPWSQLNTPAWCNYENSPINDSISGKLYNWYTVVNSSNVCPTGWHVSTHSEWNDLANYLGGNLIAGGKMKSISGWNLPNVEATNESGFSGLPGGSRNENGLFQFIGNFGHWWTASTYDSTMSWYAILSNGAGYFGQSSLYFKYGMSIRCVKD
jgi:uncharacterized protein (TIGR02145 family)